MARVPDAVIAQRAEEVWDLLAQHPEGITSAAIRDELGLNAHELTSARRWIQRNLSDEKVQVLNYDPVSMEWSLATAERPTQAMATWLMKHLRTRTKSLEHFVEIAGEQFPEAFPRNLVRQVRRTSEDVTDALDDLAALAEKEE